MLRRRKIRPDVGQIEVGIILFGNPVDPSDVANAFRLYEGADRPTADGKGASRGTDPFRIEPSIANQVDAIARFSGLPVAFSSSATAREG
jgi:hypothetical protein